MNIDFNQTSTKYGLIILIISLVAMAGWWTGKDVGLLAPFIVAVGSALHAIFVSDK